MTAIVLTRPHTHAGKPFKAGERLLVDADAAGWLIANGIARRDRQPDVPPQPQPDADGKTADAKPIQRKESKS